jgi:hypothetical protein
MDGADRGERDARERDGNNDAAIHGTDSYVRAAHAPTGSSRSFLDG